MDAIAILCQISPDLQDVWKHQLGDYLMPTREEVLHQHLRVMARLKRSVDTPWPFGDDTCCEQCGVEFEIGDELCEDLCKRCTIRVWPEDDEVYFDRYRFDYRAVLKCAARKPWRVYQRGVLRWGVFDNVVAQMNRNNYLAWAERELAGHHT